MAVAIYVTGISTPEVHLESPPLLGTLTRHMATKDKGGSKSSKKAPAKTLKQKRQTKKAKQAGGTAK